MVMGFLGFCLLVFFGILVVIDAYAFNISPLISDYRYQKAASCFIAAGYYAFLVVAGGGALLASRIMK
jgi:hypothetical protein